MKNMFPDNEYITRRLKTYCVERMEDIKCGVVDMEQQDKLNPILDEISKSVFKNADKNNPLSVFRFALRLDTRNLVNFFKGSV